MALTLGEIASEIGGFLIGDSEYRVKALAPLEEAASEELTFVLEEKYIASAKKSSAAAFITFKELEGLSRQIVVSNPRKALAQTITLFNPSRSPSLRSSSFIEIDSTAIVSDSVFLGGFTCVGKQSQIGANSVIMNQVYIGRQCVIGENCVLYPQTVILDNTRVGNHVVIHSGTVIGSDGFGYFKEGPKWGKIPHIGGVIIEDEVEIGANCAVDRGCLGYTRIKKGTKLDNMVHVAHNSTIGENCAIAAQVGMTGSVIIEDGVQIGGQAGIAAEIGEYAVIGGQAGVTKNVPPRMFFIGTPARSFTEDYKEKAMLRQFFKKSRSVQIK